MAWPPTAALLQSCSRRLPSARLGIVKQNQQREATVTLDRVVQRGSQRKYSQRAATDGEDVVTRARQRHQAATSSAGGSAEPQKLPSTADRFLAVPAKKRLYFFLGFGIFAATMLWVTDNVLPQVLPERRPTPHGRPGAGIVGRGPPARRPEEGAEDDRRE